jgi:hypothetical protein
MTSLPLSDKDVEDISVVLPEIRAHDKHSRELSSMLDRTRGLLLETWEEYP